MVDKSDCPCKKCSHPRNKHSVSYDVCWECPVTDYNCVGYCQYEKPENLEYLEWCVNKKESLDE